MQPVTFLSFTNNSNVSIRINRQDEILRSTGTIFWHGEHRVVSVSHPAFIATIYLRGRAKERDNEPMFIMPVRRQRGFRRYRKIISSIISMNSYAVYPPFIFNLPIALRWSECSQ